MTRGPAGQGMLAQADARKLLHGSVRVTGEREGWFRPWRVTDAQMRALGSCMAWHPGLYRQMGRTTAGICLEFETDSSEVAIEVTLDPEPSGTAAILDHAHEAPADVRAPSHDPREGEATEFAAADGEQAVSPGGADGERPAFDGLSCDVDGRHLLVRLPAAGDDFVAFSIDDPDSAPADGIMQLPGMGETHHVRVWLPCLRGCTLRSVVGNGTHIDPVPQRKALLVLGDSLAQGFTVGDPALAWPSALATGLGLDVVNQGIGGQVFQPGTLSGLAGTVDVARIVVELGANYRFEPCRERLVARDVYGFLSEVSRLWPDVPTWVTTSTWHNEDDWHSHPLSCWREVDPLVRAQAESHGQMTYVGGSDLMDHRVSLMTDPYGHPGREGNAQIARRMRVAMDALRGTDDERRRRALDLLAKGPRRCLPMAEMLRRGIGEVTYAEEGCVLVRVGRWQEIWASDRDLARDVIAMLVTSDLVCCLEPACVRDLELLRGLTVVEPEHVCVYEGREAPRLPKALQGRDVRPLDPSWLRTVRERYSHPSYVTDVELLGLLRDGKVLGGFEDGELVGFVGEQDSGAMGMLEVLPEHQGDGWGAVLEAAKIADVLSRGQVPWAEVWAGNKASLAIQRRLHLKVLPSNEVCWVSRPVQRSPLEGLLRGDDEVAPAPEGERESGEAPEKDGTPEESKPGSALEAPKPDGVPEAEEASAGETG